jgi:hypothetical protein
MANYRPQGVSLEIDWPSLLRAAIQKTGDGAQFKLRFEELTDAAGNRSAPHETVVKIDYAADKTPPTLPPLQHGTNFLWCVPAMSSADQLASVPQNVQFKSKKEDGFACVEMWAAGKTAFARRRYQPPWNAGRFPYMAISLRLAPDAKVKAGDKLWELLVRPQPPPSRGRRPERGNACVLSFTTATAADNKVVFGNLAWEPGRWNDLIVDVAALVRQEGGNDSSLLLRECDLILPDGAQHRLQIRAAAVMSAWGPNDLARFQPYDASGIAGIFWQGGGHSAHTLLRPARIAPPAGDSTWLKLTVRDRAGNATAPYLLPLPPPSAPVPSNLPLAEEW